MTPQPSRLFASTTTSPRTPDATPSTSRTPPRPPPSRTDNGDGSDRLPEADPQDREQRQHHRRRLGAGQRRPASAHETGCARAGLLERRSTARQSATRTVRLSARPPPPGTRPAGHARPSLLDPTRDIATEDRTAGHRRQRLANGRSRSTPRVLGRLTARMGRMSAHPQFGDHHLERREQRSELLGHLGLTSSWPGTGRRPCPTPWTRRYRPKARHPAES